MCNSDCSYCILYIVHATNVQPDVIQDANHMDRVWLYEVYKDKAAFDAHVQTPHFKKVAPVLEKR